MPGPESSTEVSRVRAATGSAKKPPPAPRSAARPGENTWTDFADARARAYLDHAQSVRGEVRFQLVTRALTRILPRRPCRVVDIGGGFGRQAVLLARAGHSVVVLDNDQTLLQAATDQVAAEEPEVARRVSLVQGAGEQAPELVGTGFDLVCCHSVLLYLADPGPMLNALARLVRPGGLVSVLTVNRDSLAIRDGLQADWRGALTTLLESSERGGRYLPTRADTPLELGRRLTRLGVLPVEWYGVRVFSDHRLSEPPPEEFADLCELEWQAGLRDPYRQFARLFHLVARREPESGLRGEPLEPPLAP
ncbi:methyltransferase domain-containing protein [Streptomyces beihaiensis]|uniref:Methyltransferase domain-containing protein n=1 Tax=Streptomyces beihaiensis TaxID=2984495 RepID=A0ABT3TUV6_9ACTN|nr:methyltransferase domain-containing protein [Streptomyces beihaiensis]MCX3060301.1 methyltransferase domain-containing protein [Streptomyces beihaiensis]